MYFRREVGIWGENLACKYLREHNYDIMERNFMCREGEVDIIAQDRNNKEVVFIEVKTRSNFKYGNPIDSVDENKQKHIKKVIKYYIYKNHMQNIAIRIDVIEVYIKKEGCQIKHVKQVL